jgi:signal peptidase I
MSQSGRRVPWFVEVVLVVVVALLVAAFVRAFVAQAFYIPSGSMEDTLQEDDWIVVSKLGRYLGSPERGDIVVFRDPGDWLPPADTSSSSVRRALEFVGVAPDSAEGDLVKRVIGGGGDQVSCCDTKGRVTVNGVAIDETYLYEGESPGDAPAGCPTTFDVTVPAGYLWVMGDHRSVSKDSRCQRGMERFVPEENLQGRAFAIVWPFARAEMLSRPDAFDDVP